MRILVAAFFLLLCAQSAFALRLVTMEEAEKILFDNSLEAGLLKTGLLKNDAVVVEAGLLPNPALNFSLETLENGVQEREETWSLSLPLDLAGKRGQRVEAAVKDREAAAFLLKSGIAALTAKMKETYSALLLLRENEKALGEILALFSDLEEKTAARLAGGDVAEAELMKLTLEKGRVAQARENLLAELETEKKRLALMLNLQADELEISGNVDCRLPAVGLEELQSLALAESPDIRGRAVAVAAAEASLSLVRREALPSPEIEAGYKKATDGFSGVVFGVTIPLPLFDRNQGGIARAAAGLEEAKLSLELQKKTALNEVSVLFARAGLLERRLRELSRQVETSRELTGIAEISYEEGEAELFGLLDAVRAEKELAMEYNRTNHELRSVIFGLEKATGADLTGKEGVQ